MAQQTIRSYVNVLAATAIDLLAGADCVEGSGVSQGTRYVTRRLLQKSLPRDATY